MLNRDDNVCVDIDILYSDGYSPEEISEIVGIDTNTIRHMLRI